MVSEAGGVSSRQTCCAPEPEAPVTLSRPTSATRHKGGGVRLPFIRGRGLGLGLGLAWLGKSIMRQGSGARDQECLRDLLAPGPCCTNPPPRAPARGPPAPR